MKNIGFAKIGKSIKFNQHTQSGVGGDNEASCTLRALANNNPDKTFYIIGRSDFSKISDVTKCNLFPYDNVIDIWQKNKLTQKDSTFYTYISDWLKLHNVHLDYTVMMVGQVGTVTIPDKIKKVSDMKDGITDGKGAAVIDMTRNYTSPIACWLNDEKPNYIEIVNDPRYVMNQSRDIFHLPSMSLGQYDYEYETNTIHSYENQERRIRKTKSVYAGMETVFCIDYEYDQQINTNRDVNFMIPLHEAKPSRYNLLKEWVLDEFPDVEIYGRWEHKDAIVDSRFNEPVKMPLLLKKLSNVKFTFIIPISKGWVTSKYIEMIHAGVIPFLHPSYDEQHHISIPDFLRPKTPREFKDRMQQLINNPEQYKSALVALRKAILKPSLYDGSFINNSIMNMIEPNYKQVDLSLYEKKTINTIEDFFT